MRVVFGDNLLPAFLVLCEEHGETFRSGLCVLVGDVSNCKVDVDKRSTHTECLFTEALSNKGTGRSANSKSLRKQRQYDLSAMLLCRRNKRRIVNVLLQLLDALQRGDNSCFDFGLGGRDHGIS